MFSKKNALGSETFIYQETGGVRKEHGKEKGTIDCRGGPKRGKNILVAGGGRLERNSQPTGEGGILPLSRDYGTFQEGGGTIQ